MLQKNKVLTKGKPSKAGELLLLYGGRGGKGDKGVS